MPSDSRRDFTAAIMTEDAKTEEYTAGGPCGVYIEVFCKFITCRTLLLKLRLDFRDAICYNIINTMKGAQNNDEQRGRHRLIE